MALTNDVAAVTGQLTARGVPFLRPDGLDLDDQGIWTTPDGTQVAWFTDPDGNTLSGGELPFDDRQGVASARGVLAAVSQPDTEAWWPKQRLRDLGLDPGSWTR